MLQNRFHSDLKIVAAIMKTTRNLPMFKFSDNKLKIKAIYVLTRVHNNRELTGQLEWLQHEPKLRNNWSSYNASPRDNWRG